MKQADLKKQVGVFFLALALACLLANPITAQDESTRILILNSYHPGFYWSDGEVEGVLSALPEDIDVSIEYMDTKRLFNDDYLDLLYTIYKQKYQNIKFDTVISLDDNALHFLLAHRDKLFPDTPIVFGGVNYFENAMLTGHKDITGIVETVDIEGTIKVALQLHPQANRVLVITDRTTSGQGNRANLEQLVQEGRIPAEVVFLDQGQGLDLPEVTELLKNAPPDSVVYYADFFQDKHGEFLSPQENMQHLSETSSAPIYVHGEDLYLGYGAVGGKLVGGFYQGEAVGNLALRVVQGEPASQIPIQQTPTKYMFDFEELDRWNIPLSALPPNSMVINQPPPSFYQRFQGVIWGTVVFIVAQGLIILILLLNMFRRKKAENALKQRAAQLTLLNEIGGQIAAVLELNDLLEKTTQIVQQRFGYHHVAIFTLDHDRDELVMTARAGAFAENFPLEHRLKLGEGVNGWVGQHGQRILANNVEIEPRYINFFPDVIKTQSELSVPIRVGREVIGVFDVQSPKRNAFDENDVMVIETLADQVAVALENARLVDAIQQELAYRRQAEETLREYSERLEDMVDERTLELREAQERLIQQEKLAILGQLAGSVAHELHNPLAALRNSTYFLRMVLKTTEPEIKEALDILEHEVMTSERIISSLLEFANPEPPIRRKVDVNNIVQHVLSGMTIPKDIVPCCHLDESQPAVEADPDQLEQALAHLILNAVQAMSAPIGNGGQLIVTSEIVDSGWVTISVVDSGVGISQENLGKLFKPLFTTKAKGIGLGLALTKILIEENGGIIEVESDGVPGKGSTFTLKLPRFHSITKQTTERSPV